MLLLLYIAICFVAYSSCTAVESIYLTLAKELPPLSFNGTISNPPNGDIELSKRRVKRNAWKYGSWPSARVPYTLDPTFNNDERSEVAKAFENYHSKTCVRFVPKETTDNDYVEILRDNNICGLAEICRRGGAQYAKFGGGCISSGIMTHELGHTICFDHEQKRPDRDNYISWDTSKCEPHAKTNANDYITLDLLYDYVSLQHYEGECYNGCIIPKMPGVTKCGSGGDLSVLDVEKINAFYNCGGCNSYRFRPISLIKDDILVVGGTDTAGDPLCPCRGYYNRDIIPGVGSVRSSSCHISYNGGGYKLDDNFEILTNPKNVNMNWIKRPSDDGSFPANAIRGGRTAEREPLYIGRCTLQLNGDPTTLIGKIHRSVSKSLYVPYEGQEYMCDDYDILVCD